MITEKMDVIESDWEEPSLYKAFNLVGIKYVGALIENGNFPQIIKQYNLQLVGYNLNSPDKNEMIYRLGVGKSNNLSFYSVAEMCNDIPQGIDNNSLKAAIIERYHYYDNNFTEHMNRRISPEVIIVVNEGHESTLSNEQMKYCYDVVREQNPEARLMFSDFENHYDKGSWTKYTHNKLNILGNRVDIVGVQMHLAQWDWEVNQLPTSDDIANTLGSYGKPIWVTEFDIETDYLKGNIQQKNIKQAQIAYTHFQGILQSGAVEAINFWPTPEISNSVNEGKTPFDSYGNPRLFYSQGFKAVCDFLLQNK